MSVCPSVRLSVTRRYSVNTAERILDFLYRQIAAPFWFSRNKRYGNIPTGTPHKGGVECKGYEEILIFDQYLALSPK